MKTKKKLTILVLFVIMGVQSGVLMAQDGHGHKATIARPASDDWKPVKISNDGNNVKNGVEFYSHGGQCNEQKVAFVKLINKNAFSVKVSYQANLQSPVINIMVPASMTVEASCGAADGNLAKLIVPVGPTKEEKQKMFEYMRTNLTVTQIQ